MKRKSVLCFVLWAVFIKLGTFFSIASQVAMYFRTRVRQTEQVLTNCQKFLIFVIAPFVLIPLLFLSCYFAKKEHNRAMRIISIVLLVHHIVALIGFVFV